MSATKLTPKQAAEKRKKLFFKTTKLSTLLQIAVDDVCRSERSKKYKIEMHDWHNPDGMGRCSVCAAGAVMSRTLRCPVTRSFVPSSYTDGAIIKRLHAIDDLRQGYIARAAREIGLGWEIAACPPIVKVTKYHDNKILWYSDMENLIALLKKNGL